MAARCCSGLGEPWPPNINCCTLCKRTGPSEEMEEAHSVFRALTAKKSRRKRNDMSQFVNGTTYLKKPLSSTFITT